jgi:zinc transporter
MTKDKSPGPFQAYLLNGKGGGRAYSWDELQNWTPDTGPLWAHLGANETQTETWLRQHSGLETLACDALLADETRPGCRVLDGDGLLVILRGVNLNPGSDPEDMVSLRLWLDENRMISLSRRRLMAVSDMAKEIESGKSECGASDLLTALIGHLLERMLPVLADLSEAVDAQGEEATQNSVIDQQQSIAELRRQVIALRRHLAPQRDALTRIADETGNRFNEDYRAKVLHYADQVTRYVEDLELLRDRIAVTHDLLAGRQAEAMNQRMMMLSIVTAVFLPLGLITGLLGINVAGIPGAEFDGAFLVVCLLLLLIFLGLLVLMRRMKWI